MTGLIHPDSGDVDYFGPPLVGNENEIKKRIAYFTGTVGWYLRKRILDEPTSGFDPFSRSELLDIFTDFKREGVAVFFSTHFWQKGRYIMLNDNLAILRKLNGYSQEEVAEKIGISRQAYAKWEKGSTIPDVEKCALLAELYGTRIDSLIRTEQAEGIGIIPPAPKGKNIWGSVTMGQRGEIVIPKGVRDKFGFTGGQRMIVLSDEIGVALIPAESFEEKMRKAMNAILSQSNKDPD